MNGIRKHGMLLPEYRNNMKQAITVLGTGLVGRAIAEDLHQSGYRVTAIDRDGSVLDELEARCGIRTICADLAAGGMDDLLDGADLVIGATPGELGFRVMESVIMAGKNLVDISFCPEDFMQLDWLAREHGVTVVPDAGVAPGLCNAILGYHEGKFSVDFYRCLVGGLPFKRDWPLEYRSSWSPLDCIEEYVRPARFRQDGEDIVKPALSDVESVEFERAGILEAWNSDGLRSLLDSFPRIPNMVEKTLRYPGTTDYLRVLRELGYFSTDPIMVKGQEIRPLDLTAALLFPGFELREGEGEFTVMRVEIGGTDQGRPVRLQYELYDVYDRDSGITSMARTTGYTATGMAGLILRGTLDRKGVIPPEFAAREEDGFSYLLGHLEHRGVKFKIT
jgi:lysine 6-dehydrogenase